MSNEIKVKVTDYDGEDHDLVGRYVLGVVEDAPTDGTGTFVLCGTASVDDLSASLTTIMLGVLAVARNNDAFAWLLDEMRRVLGVVEELDE